MGSCTEARCLRGRRARGRCDDRSFGDEPLRRRRCTRQRRDDDDVGRIAVRLGANDRRIRAEQPADRLLVLSGRRGPAGRQCRGRRQAPALVDVAGDRARQRGQRRRGARFPGRLGDPRVQREDARRVARLEPAAATGDQPAEPRCSRRQRVQAEEIFADHAHRVSRPRCDGAGRSWRGVRRSRSRARPRRPADGRFGPAARGVWRTVSTTEAAASSQ